MAPSKNWMAPLLRNRIPMPSEALTNWPGTVAPKTIGGPIIAGPSASRTEGSSFELEGEGGAIHEIAVGRHPGPGLSLAVVVDPDIEPAFIDLGKLRQAAFGPGNIGFEVADDAGGAALSGGEAFINVRGVDTQVEVVLEDQFGLGLGEREGGHQQADGRQTKE
jgi:hypothetical protein